MRIPLFPKTVVAMDFATAEEAMALTQVLQNECAIFAQQRLKRVIVPIVDTADARLLNSLQWLNNAISMKKLSYERPAEYNLELLRLNPQISGVHDAWTLSLKTTKAWDYCVALTVVPKTMSLMIESIVVASGSLFGYVQYIRRKSEQVWQDTEGNFILLDYGDKVRFRVQGDTKYMADLEFVYAAY